MGAVNFCACPRQGPEKKIDEFWEKSKINKSAHADFELFWVLNKDKLLTRENWNAIYLPQVVNSNHPTESQKFWERIFDKYSSETKFKYLVICILLLCGKNTGHESSFKKLLYNQKLHNLENQEAKLSDVKTVKKSILREILLMYIGLLTIDSIEFLTILEPEENNFVESLKEKYSIENQNLYLGKLIGEFQENVNIDDFFKKNATQLQGKYIREELHKIFLNKYNTSNKENK